MTSGAPRRTHRSSRIIQVRHPDEGNSSFRVELGIALRRKEEEKKKLSKYVSLLTIIPSVLMFWLGIVFFFPPRRKNKLFVGFTALLIIHI